ncbi:hypothetical protein [Nocardia bovistercoris]|uniref:Uncharacterized protein n=1 Tax=Nocardia bovistercoris TaxID=2785916 RepID=A0A931N312_9NOCA|nr:hypothetical protein [Nocardia bovistercoris]MBH0777277.1 hypothetical protein [Nocardia bovistercoris]
MNRNDIRPILVGVSAGLLTTAVTAAARELAEKFGSSVRTAQRIVAERDADREALRAGFRPELVTTAPGVTTLADFTVVQLLAEITERRRRLENHGFSVYRPEYLRTDFQLNAEQLEALRAEFDRRRYQPGGAITRRDRRRLDAAVDEVYGPLDPPSVTTQDADTTEQEN